MAIKKFLSLDRLAEYDGLIKEEIIENHYTKTEIDAKMTDLTNNITSTLSTATVSEVETYLGL